MEFHVGGKALKNKTTEILKIMKPRNNSMESLPAWLVYNGRQFEIHLEQKLGNNLMCQPNG